MVRTRR